MTGRPASAGLVIIITIKIESDIVSLHLAIIRMRSQIEFSICKSHLSPYASDSSQKVVIEEHSTPDDLFVSVMIHNLFNVRYRYRVKRPVLIMV